MREIRNEADADIDGDGFLTRRTRTMMATRCSMKMTITHLHSESWTFVQTPKIRG